MSPSSIGVPAMSDDRLAAFRAGFEERQVGATWKEETILELLATIAALRARLNGHDGGDLRWEFHLTTTDREALGDETSDRITNHLRRQAKAVIDVEARCAQLEEGIRMYLAQSDPGNVTHLHCALGGVM